MQIDKNVAKIKKLQQLKELLEKGHNISNCQSLKHSYTALVQAEEQLEHLRADILAAQDLWIHKKNLEAMKLEDKFRLSRLSLGNMKKMSEQTADQMFDFWKQQFTSAIQQEVQQCIETMNDKFSLKYEDGPIEWDKEFELVETPITEQFGFVKLSDEFSYYSWGEFVTGKSWIRLYCETLVYNTPVHDSEKNLTFTRLDYFKAQIETMKAITQKKKTYYAQSQQRQGQFATTLVTNPFDSQDREIITSDSLFQRIFQDQLCRKEPSRCSHDHLQRITQGRILKGKIEQLCGPLIK
jgi:hypothetical protein